MLKSIGKTFPNTFKLLKLKSIGKIFIHSIMQEMLEFKFEMNIQLFLPGVISEKNHVIYAYGKRIIFAQHWKKETIPVM